MGLFDNLSRSDEIVKLFAMFFDRDVLPVYQEIFRSKEILRNGKLMRKLNEMFDKAFDVVELAVFQSFGGAGDLFEENEEDIIIYLKWQKKYNIQLDWFTDQDLIDEKIKELEDKGII